jgi:hypothetical protein
MKTKRLFNNTDHIPWDRVNDDVSIKILNGKADRGPYTAILHSMPRTPDPERGQYHSVDEEFYCLDGYFTFDGENWFRKGSYIHFPPNYVHGSRVHVENGYLLYLRMGGTVTTDWVNRPKIQFPYLLDNSTSLEAPTIQRRVTMAGQDCKKHGRSGLKSRLLRKNPKTRESTSILDWSRKNRGRGVLLTSDSFLEVFVASGSFEGEEKELMTQGAYAFAKGKALQIPLRCLKTGRVVVSHRGDLQIHTA